MHQNKAVLHYYTITLSNVKYKTRYILYLDQMVINLKQTCTFDFQNVIPQSEVEVELKSIYCENQKRQETLKWLD